VRSSRSVLALTLACALFAACSTGTRAPAKPVVGAVAHVVLRVGATTTQPEVLIDQRGDTLYVSRREAAGRQSCTGSCLQVWPLLLLQPAGTVDVGASAVSRAAIKIVPVADGRAVAYDGYLLHTYVGDPAPGGDAGEGVGGQWSAITPAGRPTK
jgi:predicted lipoprotein with Yx(FWY)xxD motif